MFPKMSKRNNKWFVLPLDDGSACVLVKFQESTRTTPTRKILVVGVAKQIYWRAHWSTIGKLNLLMMSPFCQSKSFFYDCLESGRFAYLAQTNCRFSSIGWFGRQRWSCVTRAIFNLIEVPRSLA
jgi:hypothetical protein